MNVEILCVGGSAARWQAWGKSLRDDGYVIVHASDEVEAVEVLKSCRVAVVCIDSIAMFEDGSKAPITGTRLRDADPHVPIVLVHSGAVMPEHYEKHVDVVIDGQTFTALGTWLIEELREVRFPLFVEWFDSWKQRQPGLKSRNGFPDS